MHEPRHKISWEKYQNHWIVVEIFSDRVTNIITMIMLVKNVVDMKDDLKSHLQAETSTNHLCKYVDI